MINSLAIKLLEINIIFHRLQLAIHFHDFDAHARTHARPPPEPNPKCRETWSSAKAKDVCPYYHPLLPARQHLCSLPRQGKGKGARGSFFSLTLSTHMQSYMYHFWGRVALSWALIHTLCAYNELVVCVSFTPRAPLRVHHHSKPRSFFLRARNPGLVRGGCLTFHA